MSTLKVDTITKADGTGSLSVPAESGTVVTTASPSLGRRNLIINGAMQVAQRGTSFSSLTTGQYTLDRWEYNPSGATATITQESFAAGTEEGGCKNYLKAAFSVGNDNGGMIYKVEDVQSLHSAESFTLSFYAKGTNPTGGAVRVRVRQYFGSGGSATVTVYEDTITLTSSWQRFTITDTYDDLTGKTIGTGSYADITIDQPGTDSGTDAWELNITGVQLEVGSVATPFEHRSYGEELALCQRYYEVIGKYENGQNSPIVAARYYTSGNCGGPFHMKTEKRAVPTLVQTTGTDYYAFFGNGAGDGISSINLAWGGNTRVLFLENTTEASGTQGYATMLATNNSNAFVAADAEL